MPTTEHASIQIQIVMDGAAVRRWRPVKSTFRQMIQVWIETGELPPEVAIKATIWGQRLGPVAVRRRLQEMRLHFGAPGLVKAYARPDTTYCDYDQEEAPAVSQVYELAQLLGLRPLMIRDDRTARGWHRIVRWNRKFSPAELVCLQMTMESDPHRERFNLLRVLSGAAGRNRRWNLLFERKF